LATGGEEPLAGSSAGPEAAVRGGVRVRGRARAAAPLPPGPRRPVWAQTAAWIHHPTRLLEHCQRRYGEPFTLRIAGAGTCVFVSDPRAIKSVFQDAGERLRGGEGNAPLRPVLGPHSLLVMDGPAHLRQRKALLPPFHGERMRAYGALIRDIALRTTRDWPTQRALAAHPVLQAISLEVIVRAVFGLTDPARIERCLALLGRFTQYLSGTCIYLPVLQRDLLGLSPWRRFTRVVVELRDLLAEEIRERRGEPAERRSDILSLLLSQDPERNESPSERRRAGEEQDEEALSDQLLTLLAAGHETTATALVWALRHALADEHVRERLRSEIDGAAADPETLAALPYLDAVCKETLRLFPIVPVIGRRAAVETTLLGRPLPAGVTVIPCIYLTHRRAELFPEPGRFRPERFLEREYAPYEFLPFGGGIRRCIGAAFALYEMKIVLGTLFAHFTLKLDRAPGTPRPVRRNVTLYPGGGARIVAERR